MYRQKTGTHPLFCSLLFSLVISCFAVGQNDQLFDTLALARQAIKNGEFKSAINLLNRYEKNHPKDSNAKDLLAHAYYWSGDLILAQKTFKDAIAAHPEQPNLKLGYARFLFEIKVFKKAQSLFLQYLKSDPLNIEALLNLGYIHFWQEEYKTAGAYFNKILRHYPDQPEAKKMLAEIKALRAIVVEIKNDYQIDSQPIEFLNPSINATQYQNQWLHPSINMGAYFFNVENGNRQAQYLELGNHFYFKKPKFDLALSGGVYRNHFDEKINWIGKAVLKKANDKRACPFHSYRAGLQIQQPLLPSNNWYLWMNIQSSFNL